MKTLMSIVLSLGLVLLSVAHADSTERAIPIPANAQKAKMYVVSDRVLNLNDKDYTLAPGGLIYNEQNLIVQTQSLSGKYMVRVIFDGESYLSKVWILTAAEDKVDAPWLGGTFWQRIRPW